MSKAGSFIRAIGNIRQWKFYKAGAGFTGSKPSMDYEELAMGKVRLTLRVSLEIERALYDGAAKLAVTKSEFAERAIRLLIMSIEPIDRAPGAGFTESDKAI